MTDLAGKWTISYHNNDDTVIKTGLQTLENILVNENPYGDNINQKLLFLEGMLLISPTIRTEYIQKYISTLRTCVLATNNQIQKRAFRIFSILEGSGESIEDLMDTELGAIYRELHSSEEYKKELLEFKAIMHLHPEGRIALEAADWYYDQAKKNNYGILDAGLISLAYFRVLEVELNYRTIKGILKKYPYKNISNEYKNQLKQRDPVLYKEFWKRELSNLKSVESFINGKKGNSGFELGTLRVFLEKIRNNSTTDGLSKSLYEVFMNLLTEPGKAAYINGEIEELISKDVLDKYRNPPAHTRYLPLSIVEECRIFVLKALALLNDWFI